jgi:hypothetical protein
MNSFRLFLIEQENKPLWYENFPMPEMAGNAIMAARQYAYNDLQNNIQETHGQVIAGRGFPMSKGATSLLSTVPITSSPSVQGRGKDKKVAAGEQSNIGPMIYAFDWMVNRGLFDALIIRKKLAAQATQELRQKLGDEEFTNMVRGNEITEDMVYSAKAHQAIPALKQWFDALDPSVMNPKSLIRYPSGGKKWRRFSLDDINKIIDLLNEKQEFVTLDKFNYGGPDGFIEWIEDGPWAEKVGTVDNKQPWRTKHGVSLHNAQVVPDPENGQLSYQFGGVISPLRNLQGSYQKKLRDFLHGMLGDTSRAIRGKAEKIVGPEHAEMLQQILGLYDSNKANRINLDHDFATQRGYDQTWPSNKDTGFEPDQASDYALHLMFIRAETEKRAAINGEPKAKEVAEKILSKQELDTSDQMWIKGMENQYGTSPSDLKDIIACQEKSKITPEKKAEFLKAFGADIDKNHFRLGSAKFKSGTANVRTKSIINAGHKYVKFLIDGQKEPAASIIDQFIGQDIDNGSLGQVDFTDIVKELEIAKDNFIPKLALDDDQPVELKGEFGTEVTDYRPITQDEIDNLLKQGYQWLSDKDGENLANSKGGILVNADKMISLNRTKSGDWEAMYIDDDPGKPMKGYSTDVPTILPSRRLRYGGGDYVASHAGSAQNMGNIFKDMQSNPQKWGYGIGNIPKSVEDDMANTAYQMIRLGTAGGPENKVYTQFANSDKNELGLTLLGHVTERLTGPILKYGDLNNQATLDTLRNQMMSDANGLPGIEDTRVVSFWINHGKKIVMQGDPKVVPTNDYSPEAWSNRDNEIPEGVYNAFLTTGALYRRIAARKFTRDDQKMDIAGQAPEGRGKEGEALSYDAEDTGGNNAADRMASVSARTGTANTKRNRLGIDRMGGGFADDIERVNLDKVDKIDVNAQSMRRERNMESDSKYTLAYKRQSEFMNDIENTDSRELSQSIRSLPNDTTNTVILGKLDAIADKVLNALRFQVAQKPSEESLVSFIKDVCLPLNRIYIKSDGNMSAYFSEILGGHELLKKAEDAYNQERQSFFQQDLRPAAQTVPSAPQEPSSSNLSRGGSLKDILAARRAGTGPEATPSTPPTPSPRSGGLGGFIKKKNESYSFRTRYLRKLAETSAVYGGEKDFEGNWEGAVGDPLGVSIKGEVEDRQSNPDGTKGKKHGKSKSKSK